MPKKIHITKHAQKRIDRGDKGGLRTVLTAAEVMELIEAPFAISQDQETLVYSHKDHKPLIVVTARQKQVLVTVYGIERIQNRLPEMISKALAGVPFEFSVPPQPERYDASCASLVKLGTMKERRGEQHFREIAKVANYFDLNEKRNDILESRGLHSMLVEAAEGLRESNEISCAAHRDLYTRIETTRMRAHIPIWVSYNLLGLPRPL